MQTRLTRTQKTDSLKKKNTNDDAQLSQGSSTKALTVIVVGASGHLAKNKTYPSLYALFQKKMLPAHVNIVGYARSKIPLDKFRSEIAGFLKGDSATFMNRCTYVSGQYNSAADFAAVAKFAAEAEATSAGSSAGSNRLFYFAIPPSQYADAARSCATAMSQNGWNRFVVEKPFGHDLPSSTELSELLGKHLTEDQIYRIDHYLGKEVVQQILPFRFGNSVFEPLHNRQHVQSVIINWLETDGVEGRGYFDSIGLIRDVIQNHLLQVLTLVAMESPRSTASEHVRDAKVELLRAVRTVQLSDIVIGQYTRSADGKHEGYLEDKSVPKDSRTETFAQIVMWIDNARWKGVPFIIRAGKACHKRKCEVRVQYRNSELASAGRVECNKLVFRIQPDEAIYLHTNSKPPGLSIAVGAANSATYADLVEPTEMSLLLAARKPVTGPFPDGYEVLLRDVLRGDQSLFVRRDELDVAWAIFTPLLHALYGDGPAKSQPAAGTPLAPLHAYTYGTNGPVAADEKLRALGVHCRRFSPSLQSRL